MYAIIDMRTGCRVRCRHSVLWTGNRSSQSAPSIASAVLALFGSMSLADADRQQFSRPSPDSALGFCRQPSTEPGTFYALRHCQPRCTTLKLHNLPERLLASAWCPGNSLGRSFDRDIVVIELSLYWSFVRPAAWVVEQGQLQQLHRVGRKCALRTTPCGRGPEMRGSADARFTEA